MLELHNCTYYFVIKALLVKMIFIISGVDAVSEGISKYVRVVDDRSDGHCPVCLCELLSDTIVVALTRCHHRLHLDCLNSMLTSQPNAHQVNNKL